MKSPHTKNTLLQAATSQPTNQSLHESIFSPTQEKLKNKKFPFLQKNKTSQPHSPKQTSTLTGCDSMQIDSFNEQGRRRASANKVLPKAGVTGFYDTYVLDQTLVFQINSSTETPRLRQYPKRWTKF
jgi:hypothetical protein